MTAAISAPSLSQLAGSSPATLVFQLAFWSRQRTLIVAIVTFAITIFVLAPYTYAEAGGWEWFSVLVQLIALGGTYIAARSLATLEVDRAIVGEVERRGTDYLIDLKVGKRTRIDLDQLEHTMVPSNPSDPPPAMIRLFQHIIKEARDRRFESSVNVMQPYREEPLEEIFKLQNLQKIALWLGILGTFIGLLIAINESTATGVDFAEIVKRMFHGLKISFSASLAGLQVAVFLGALLLILRKEQEGYFKQMEGAVVTMLSLARNSINKDEYIAEFAQIRETVDELTDTVYAHAQEIKEQTDQIRVGLTRLADAKASFDTFLLQISRTQDDFIADIRSLYDTISLKNLTTNLEATLTQATRLMGTRMEVAGQQIDSRLGEFNAAVQTFGRQLDLQSKENAEMARKLSSQIATANNENITANRAIVARLQDAQSRDTSTVGAIRTDLRALSRDIVELTQAVKAAGYVQTGPKTFRQFLAWLFGW